MRGCSLLRLGLILSALSASAIATGANGRTRTAANFVAVHGVDEAGYQAWVNRLPAGMRIDFVNAHSVNGSPRFSAIAISAGQRLWEARHGLTAAEHQARFDDLSKRGYRLTSLSGYLDRGQERYAATWVNDGSGLGWSARHGISSDRFQAEFDAAVKRGERLSRISVYPSGKRGEQLYAAIFRAGGQSEWLARNGLTERSYQRLIDEMAGQGFWPNDVSVAGSANSRNPVFAVVFSKDPVESWQARHDLDAAAYQREFDKWTRQGYRPWSISGYESRGESRYAAVFVKETDKKPEPGPEPPVSGTEVPELAALDQAVKTFMSERRIPSGSLAVSKDGKLVYGRGFGHMDRERTRLTPPAVKMRLASVAKPITAAAVRKLIREGKLSLDLEVFPYLAIEPPAGRTPDPRLDRITVKHLLEHRGGWDRGQSFDPMFRAVEIARDLGVPAPASSRDVIRYMRGRPLQFDPGARSSYSNFGFCVLGRVIEKAAGKPYIDYVRDDVMTPIQAKGVALGRSLAHLRDPLEPFYSNPGRAVSVFDPSRTVEWPDGGFHLEAMDAHGGLIASAPDLVRFLDAYWINGEPRRRGSRGGDWVFNGSLPGTWTYVVQRGDGVNFAVLFNQREDGSGRPYDAILKALNSAIDGIARWPGQAIPNPDS